MKWVKQLDTSKSMVYRMQSDINFYISPFCRTSIIIAKMWNMNEFERRGVIQIHLTEHNIRRVCSDLSRCRSELRKKDWQTMKCGWMPIFVMFIYLDYFWRKLAIYTPMLPIIRILSIAPPCIAFCACSSLIGLYSQVCHTSSWWPVNRRGSTVTSSPWRGPFSLHLNCTRSK